MVDVAQLVEPRIVIPVVVGSNPIDHPNLWTYSLSSHVYNFLSENSVLSSIFAIHHVFLLNIFTFINYSSI